MEDYTPKFYQLISRNEVHQIEILVGGLIYWWAEGTDSGDYKSV